jgi:hypothetical protein
MVSHTGYDSIAHAAIYQITSAGAKCDILVNTFCSRKISSHTEVVFFTILVTILSIIVFVTRLATQLSISTPTISETALRRLDKL